METVIEEELNKVTMANDTTQQRCLDLGGLPGYAEWPTLVEEAKRGVKIWTVKFEPEEQLNLNGPLYTVKIEPPEEEQLYLNGPLGTVKIDPEEEEPNLNAVKIEPEEEQLNLNGPLGTVKIEPPEEEQLNLNAVKIEPEEEQLNLNAVKIESEEEQLNLNGPFSEGKSSNEARAPDETKTTGTGPNLPGEQDEPQKIKIEVVESLCQRDEDSISSNYTLSVFPSDEEDEEDEEDALVIECDWYAGDDVIGLQGSQLGRAILHNIKEEAIETETMETEINTEKSEAIKTETRVVKVEEGESPIVISNVMTLVKAQETTAVGGKVVKNKLSPILADTLKTTRKRRRGEERGEERGGEERGGERRGEERGEERGGEVVKKKVCEWVCVKNEPLIPLLSLATPPLLVPNSTPEEDRLVTTAAVSDSARLDGVVVEATRLSQAVDAALRGTAPLRRKNKRANKRRNKNRNFNAVVTAVSQEAGSRRGAERVYRPMEEKRKLFIGAQQRDGHEHRMKLGFERLSDPQSWKEIHYVRLGAEHTVPWVNARWERRRVTSMLKCSTRVYCFDKGWEGRENLEFTDMRPAMVRVFRHNDSGALWAAVRADMSLPPLSPNGEFIGKYTAGCPWGNPYCVYGIFSGGGWRCFNRNKHVPITADDVVRAGWDEEYWAEREHVSSVRWTFIIDKGVLLQSDCPEECLGPVWRGLVGRGATAFRSKRRVMNMAHESGPATRTNPYANC